VPLTLTSVKPKQRFKRPSLIQAETRKALNDFMVKVSERMEQYPPEHPGQSYIRTERLKRGWGAARTQIRFQKTGLAYVAEMQNPVGYSGVVQGRIDQQQARFKNWGWKSATEITEEIAKDFTQRIQIAITPF